MSSPSNWGVRPSDISHSSGTVHEVRREVLIRALATSVAVDPTNRALRQLYAQFLVEDGRGPEALEQCVALLAQRGDDPEVLELRSRAEALCERTVQAVIGSIPDSVDELLAMWGPLPDVDLSVRRDPSAALPHAPLGRLVRPQRSLDSLGGIDALKDALRAFVPRTADSPVLASLAGISGLTLYGPPGAGKQTLIEAFAAELGADCLTVPVDELLAAAFDGRGLDMGSIVDFAARRGRCVIHLQDLEELWVGAASYLSIERSQLAEQVATILDRRIHPSGDLIVVASSSRPWKLPATLVSPERLGRSLFVPPPDLYARAQMIWEALGSEHRENLDVWEVARATDGFSGDDIARACRVVVECSDRHFGSGITARVTTRTLLAAMESAESSIERWVGHARLALATLVPSLQLTDLVRWLDGDPG